MSRKRKSITKKIRFEVFKRDSFTCQYCGGCSPDIVLEIDHINPIANGGDNDILNLITSCVACNRGKGAKLLSDKSVIETQKKQLNELNKRREQLEMMIKWRDEVSKITDKKLSYAKDTFCELAGCNLTEFGDEKIKKWIKKFSLSEVLDSINISCEQYLIPDEESGRYTKESIDKTFSYIPRICKSKRQQEDKPYLKDIYYIRGILRNRISYCPEHRVLSGLLCAYETESATLDELRVIALSVRNWTQLREQMADQYGVDL